VPVQCITAQIYALHASFGITLITTAVHFSYALFCFFALFQIVKLIKVLKQTIGVFSLVIPKIDFDRIHFPYKFKEIQRKYMSLQYP
jgi:hypothetical protein